MKETPRKNEIREGERESRKEIIEGALDVEQQ